MPGYLIDFIGEPHKVALPDYSYYKFDIAKNIENKGDILDYTYYSVLQSKSRRVPIFSASNIYRTHFVQVERTGSFKKDQRIQSFEQLSSEDYIEFNSIMAAKIDKGHMTKREDVQWDKKGKIEDSIEAAKSTFYYPNSSPQHHRLNNGVWKHLENSIIIKGRVEMPAKICVFTGPVLGFDDPLFKTQLQDGSQFKIPILFWKVIYYVKHEDKNLYYAGFLMGQINPLREDNLIIETIPKKIPFEKKRRPLKPFLEFEEDEKYQVPVSYIEELTELSFTNAIDKHRNDKAVKLRDVQVKSFTPNGFNRNYAIVEGLNV